MFIFAFLKKSEIAQAPAEIEKQDMPITTPYDSITRIDAKHFYDTGEHVIAGEILLPTMCDLLQWEPVVRESMPEGVTVEFTVLNNAENCAQAVVAQRFLVPFRASESAMIGASLNGRIIELNLIPAAPGEKPEDYELFLKG